VPKVIGMRAPKAIDKLATMRLDGHFTAFAYTGSPCAGLPTRGRIVDQHPLPGAITSVRKRVAVQAGCPSLVPSCRRYQTAMLTFGRAPDYTDSAGAEQVIVRLSHVAGPPCQLDLPVDVQLANKDGTLAAISGNPSTYEPNKRTGLGEEVELTWSLGGLVSPPQRLSIEVRMGPLRAEGHVHSPRTEDRAAPTLSIGAYPDAISTSNGPQAYQAALLTTRAYGQ
jgi:hypothetical protein